MFSHVRCLHGDEKMNVSPSSTPTLFRGSRGGGRLQLIFESGNNPLILTPGDGFEWRKSESHTTIITESGLYKPIMRSDKATARPFQDWVTKDVLPSIRRTG